MAVTTTDLLNQALALIGESAVTSTTDGSNAATVFTSLWDNIRTSVLTLAPWNATTVRVSLTADIYDVTNSWAASTAVAQGYQIVDSNGNVQEVLTPGTTGTTAPTWSTISGENTLDGTSPTQVTWVMKRANGDYVLPDWGFEYQFTLPSDCLRVDGLAPVATWPIWPDFSYYSVGYEQDHFRIENGKLLCDESEIHLLYGQDQDPPTDSMLQSVLVNAIAEALSFPITRDPNIQKARAAALEVTLAKAKHINSQQGSAQQMPESAWLAARY